MAKTANLVTKEVAWSGNKPTKYQSSLEYPVTPSRTIRILGEPMSTEEQSLDSLCVELAYWEESMAAFKKAIK